MAGDEPGRSRRHRRLIRPDQALDPFRDRATDDLRQRTGAIAYLSHDPLSPFEVEHGAGLNFDHERMRPALLKAIFAQD